MNQLASNDFYDVSIEEELAIIAIKEKVFELITDVQLSEKLLSLINSIDHNPNVKALLFFNTVESFSEAQYERFISRIMGKIEINKDCDPTRIAERNLRFREINILNQLIKRLASVQKIIVSGIQGTVVTPFVGAALVADFRYAAEGTTFSMIHNKYGLHPSGGLPYFLSNMVHHSKAFELQLQDYIEAQEALDLGLINGILPGDNFKEHLFAIVREKTARSYCTIRDTKRLTNFSRKSLNDYFDFEGRLLNL